ncbi:MFS transporter [Thalassovita taeanensis]|uniref:Major Facilitator Superfamily protein n=1 Tax=Thalassovita taeanensis TaxID=657014 RepID=A0A1H9B9M9_9RHOB|nr:MFS transporter [Thalassovita taeanensis]SEP85457.1 Major Facilitator Superfamily protein [Thalassovita taeanensis]
MKAGLVFLCAAYVLSQFFRAFLAVLTQALERDIAAGPEDLAFASGLWFLTFAAMQIPVGWALDRIGPRRVAAVLLAIGGGGGALMFAMAQGPGQIGLAMALIGVGCAPVLMASYYIFAREYPPAMFATLGAVMIGVGTLGNLAGSVPLAMAVDLVGWRATLGGLAGVSVALAAGVWLTVQDPPKLEGNLSGSVLELLRRPELWLIFPLMFVSYAPAAGLRGLWIGPYLSDVFGADAAAIGRATLVMGVAMVAGTLIYGPLDRVFRTRKWVIFTGNVIVALICFALVLWPDNGVISAVALCAAVGFFGMCFPLIMAHGRSFIPPHLTGRGVTLMNLFGIGGVGLFQVVTGQLHTAVAAQGGAVERPYQVVFGFFAAVLVAGLLPYVFCRDRLD